MGAKLTSQKPPQLNSVDLKVDNIKYSPIPFGRLLDGKVSKLFVKALHWSSYIQISCITMGKVGKFTVEVDQLEEQLISFLQEEFWLTQSDEELLHSGFFKVIQFCILVLSI